MIYFGIKILEVFTLLHCNIPFSANLLYSKNCLNIFTLFVGVITFDFHKTKAFKQKLSCTYGLLKYNYSRSTYAEK